MTGESFTRRTLLESPSKRQRIARDLWGGSDRDSTPLGGLLPGIERLPPPSPPHRDVSVRASNLLRTAGMASWEEIAQVPPMRLRGLPNLGAKTFLEIVDMVLLAWAEAEDLPALPEWSVETPKPSPAPTFAPDPPVRAIADAEVDALAGALRWLWERHGSRTFAEALADAAELRTDDVPRQVAESVAHLASSQLASSLNLSPFGAEDWRWLFEFDARTRTILEQRVFAAKKLTLDELATEAGVTRERIRQIEKRVVEQLEDRKTFARARGLHHLAARLRRNGRGLLSPERLDLLVGELLDESGAPEDLRQLCSGVLRATAGPWSSWCGYVADLELIRILNHMTEGWRAAGSETPIPAADYDALCEVLRMAEPPEELLTNIGVRLIEGVPMWWGRTHGDRAVAVLKASDRVMRFPEIHAAIGPAVSPRSLQNALLAERRMMRRGKETWGLRSWGGEEYTGLFDELEQAIERAGGRVNLAEVVERFVADFDVKAGSVLTYAADRRFIKHPDGTLAMRTADDPEVTFAHIPIEQTAGAYRLDGTWHLCVEIDDDVVRGSGRQIRRGIGQEAGLEPDLTFAVTYDAGSVIFTWPGSQPHIGSVRELMSHHGCTPGDLLMLPLAGAEPRPSRVVRAADRSGWSGVARVAAEMGLDPSEIDEDEQPLEVADAIGLPPGADWHDIADRIRDRRDNRVLAHLPEHLR